MGWLSATGVIALALILGAIFHALEPYIDIFNLWAMGVFLLCSALIVGAAKWLAKRMGARRQAGGGR